MAVYTLASLLIQETKAAIYEKAIEIAEALGLPVSSWQAGDPTRSVYHLESTVLATLEELVVGYIKSGFLEFSKGTPWFKICAEQFFGVVVPPATYATTDVVLTNGGGGFFPDIQPGDLTFRSSLTDKTYTNTTGGTLNAGVGQTLTITVVADESGSDSSAGAGEIDELITTLPSVTCSNPTAAIGVDEQDEDVTIQQCTDKLGSFSPDGPAAAYAYVARNSALTGTSAVTRVRVFSESDTGDVTVLIAGPSGAVSEPIRALVEAAILRWATPLCITPTVSSATNVVVPVTYTLWLYTTVNKTTLEITDEVQTALETLFKNHPIAGDIIPPALTGTLYQSLIEATIRNVFPDHAFRVTVAAPAGDTAIGNVQVAALGAVTPTINLVTAP